jgi:hypothetical protein
LIIKVNVASYAITGAIVSFCLTRPKGDLSRWALALPAVISLSLALIFVYSSRSAVRMRDDMKAAIQKLPIDTYHDFTPLILVLVALFLVHGISAIGLATLIWILA